MYNTTSFILLCLIPLASCAQPEKEAGSGETYPIEKTEAEWRQQLSDKQYHVLREKGTERAFTGEYNNFKKKGTFTCAACSTPLFTSDTKFDSGTGWPSFYDVVSDTNVKEISDRSHGMVRTEVVCGKCGGHLGHLFPDGPKPTGLRYCINSVSLGFEENR